MDWNRIGLFKQAGMQGCAEQPQPLLENFPFLQSQSCAASGRAQQLLSMCTLRLMLAHALKRQRIFTVQASQFAIRLCLRTLLPVVFVVAGCWTLFFSLC